MIHGFNIIHIAPSLPSYAHSNGDSTSISSTIKGQNMLNIFLKIFVQRFFSELKAPMISDYLNTYLLTDGGT